MTRVWTSFGGAHVGRVTFEFGQTLPFANYSPSVLGDILLQIVPLVSVVGNLRNKSAWQYA
jgi:hypothetical protein